MKKKIILSGLLSMLVLGCSACLENTEKESAVKVQEVPQVTQQEEAPQVTPQVMQQEEAQKPLASVEGSYQYRVSYDEEVFFFETVEGIDSITSYEVSETGMPLATLVIVQNTGVSTETFVEDMQSQAGADVIKEEVTIGQDNIGATHLSYMQDDYDVDMYVLDRGENCLLIEVRVKAEADKELGTSLKEYLNSIQFHA